MNGIKKIFQILPLETKKKTFYIYSFVVNFIIF